MKRMWRFALVPMLLASCGSSPASTKLTTNGAWARASTPGSIDGVVYLALTSPSTDQLIGVSVPATTAAAAELHEAMGSHGGAAMPNMPEMATGDGAMTMMPLPAVDLPAGKAVALQPGGKHILLKRLSENLVAGETFPLTLQFSKAGSVTITVTVSNNPPG
jgi:periplasmic copper chaperone A